MHIVKALFCNPFIIMDKVDFLWQRYIICLSVLKYLLSFLLNKMIKYTYD